MTALPTKHSLDKIKARIEKLKLALSIDDGRHTDTMKYALDDLYRRQDILLARLRKIADKKRKVSASDMFARPYGTQASP